MANQTAAQLSERQEKLEKARLRAFRAWGVIGVALIVAAVFFGLLQIKQAVGIIIIAFIIAFILAPIADRIEGFGVPRLGATALAFLLGIAILTLFFLIIVPVISEQVTSFVNELPRFISTAQNSFNEIYTQYESQLQDTNVKETLDHMSRSIMSGALNFANTSGQGLISAGTSVVSSVFTFFMALVVAFWMVKDAPRILDEALTIVGPKRAEEYEIMTAVFSRALGGYMKGIIIVSACTGLIAGIGYAIIGVPYAAFLGLITGVLNIIPIIGPWVGGGIAAIIGLTVNPLTALFSIIVSIIAQQLTDTLVSPRVMYSAVAVHPILVILGLTAGGAIAGIPGMILSVPLIAAIKGVFIYYFETKTGRQIVSDDGAFFTGTPHLDEDGNPQPAYDATGGSQYYEGKYAKQKPSAHDTLMTIKRLTGSWRMPKDEDDEETPRKKNDLDDDGLPRI